MVVFMNLNPFINLISNFISLYEFALFIWLILHWLVRFNILNIHQPLVKYLINFGSNLFEPVFSRLRNIIPTINGIDLSPVVLLLFLNFTKDFLFTYLYKI